MTSSPPSGYRSQSIDTTIEADQLRFRLYRQRSPLERLQLAARFRQKARQLSLTCLQQNFAQLAKPALARKVAQAWLADKCPPDWIPQLDAMNWSQDPLAVAALIARILDAARIVYYVTGGVAAIAHGEPRATLDLDID